MQPDRKLISIVIQGDLRHWPGMVIHPPLPPPSSHLVFALLIYRKPPPPHLSSSPSKHPSSDTREVWFWPTQTTTLGWRTIVMCGGRSDGTEKKLMPTASSSQPPMTVTTARAPTPATSGSWVPHRRGTSGKVPGRGSACHRDACKPAPRATQACRCGSKSDEHNTDLGNSRKTVDKDPRPDLWIQHTHTHKKKS